MGEGLAGTWGKESESKELGGGHGGDPAAHVARNARSELAGAGGAGGSWRGRRERTDGALLCAALRGLWVQGGGGEQEEGTDRARRGEGAAAVAEECGGREARRPI